MTTRSFTLREEGFSTFFAPVSLTSTRWPSYRNLTCSHWRYTGCAHNMNFLYVKAIESYHLPLRETRTKLHIKPLQKLEKKNKKSISVIKSDSVYQCRHYAVNRLICHCKLIVFRLFSLCESLLCYCKWESDKSQLHLNNFWVHNVYKLLTLCLEYHEINCT